MITLNGDIAALYEGMTESQLRQLLALKEWQLRSKYTDYPYRKAKHIEVIKQVIKKKKDK